MLTIMVPALNEEKNIAKTISNIVMSAKAAELKEYEIIVVNDGSTDRTGAILADLQKTLPCLRVVTHATPRGMGNSYIEVIELAKYDRMTCFAGDNNSHWSLMEALFRNVNRAEVVCSYFINTEVRKRARNLLSTIFSTLYVTTFDLNVKYINGNAIYSVPRLKELKLQSTRYTWCAEINTKMLRKDVTFFEVAGWSNPDPEANQSKAIRISTLLDVIKRFFGLVLEIYVTRREEYAFRARRVGMPELDTVEAASDENHHASKGANASGNARLESAKI